MKLLEVHRQAGLSNESSAFEFLKSGFQENFRHWDFYVDWVKARANRDELEIDLNLLNSLLGKPNVADAFRALLRSYPHLVRVIPILFATRVDTSGLFRMIMNPGEFPPRINEYDLLSLPSSDTDFEKILDFVERSGLLEIFSDSSVRNLVDYVFGVEVGMDTHTRKNRSGKTMEDVVESKLVSLQRDIDFEYLTQATKVKMKKHWGISTIEGLNVKTFDFAVRYRGNVSLIEVNYYAAGGSKLSPVVGNFVGMREEIRNRGMSFVWVTDGLGWGSEGETLRRGFHELDFVFNLRLLELGALEEALGLSR